MLIFAFMKKIGKIWLWSCLGVIFVAALVYGAYGTYKFVKYRKEAAPQAVELTQIPKVQLPQKLNISMPFYPQAPYADWNYPYQEACEEASVLLVVNLLNNMNLTLDGFDRELLALIEYEKQYLGFYEDTTIQQTAEIVEKRYGLKTKIHENPTFEDIQRTVGSGHLVIAPFAGKLIGNPFYRNGGPKYHMMVIKGYDATQEKVVTHDVGTKRGTDYVYKWERLNYALHDWNGGDVSNGSKKILEIWKE